MPTAVNDYSGIRLATVLPLTSHKDLRGSVRETFRESWFPDLTPIKQLVRSESQPRTVRGMHLHRTQVDLWHFVSVGEWHQRNGTDAAFVVVRLFDHRTNRQEFIRATGDEVIAIPAGVSHGFYAPYGATLIYALTAEYDGSDEFGWYFADGVVGVRSNDPRMHGIWPDKHDGLVISERDLRAPRLADFKG